MSNNDFATMKDIGRLLGLTSHQVGKRLKQLGLRTHEGRPSAAAFNDNLVARKWAADGEHYLWAWDMAEVVRLLADTEKRPEASV